MRTIQITLLTVLAATLTACAGMTGVVNPHAVHSAVKATSERPAPKAVLYRKVARENMHIACYDSRASVAHDHVDGCHWVEELGNGQVQHVVAVADDLGDVAELKAMVHETVHAWGYKAHDEDFYWVEKQAYHYAWWHGGIDY